MQALSQQQLRPATRLGPCRRRAHAASAVRACPSAAAAPGELLRVPAYKGAAVKVKKGELLKVINTHGQQARARRRPP